MTKPNISRSEDEYKTLAKIQDHSTLGDKPWKELRAAIDEFITTHQDECKETPRNWSKKSWKNTVNNFLTTSGLGSSVWSQERDGFCSDSDLAFDKEDDRDDIGFLTFALMKLRIPLICRKRKPKPDEYDELASSQSSPSKKAKGKERVVGSPSVTPTPKKKDVTEKQAPQPSPVRVTAEKKALASIAEADDEAMIDSHGQIKDALKQFSPRPSPLEPQTTTPMRGKEIITKLSEMELASAKKLAVSDEDEGPQTMDEDSSDAEIVLGTGDSQFTFKCNFKDDDVIEDVEPTKAKPRHEDPPVINKTGESDLENDVLTFVISTNTAGDIDPFMVSLPAAVDLATLIGRIYLAANQQQREGMKNATKLSFTFGGFLPARVLIFDKDCEQHWNHIVKHLVAFGKEMGLTTTDVSFL